MPSETDWSKKLSEWQRVWSSQLLSFDNGICLSENYDINKIPSKPINIDVTISIVQITEIDDVKDCQGDHELQLDAGLAEESERDRNKERPSD